MAEGSNVASFMAKSGHSLHVDGRRLRDGALTQRGWVEVRRALKIAAAILAPSGVKGAEGQRRGRRP
jgi:hypothetical protein